MSKKSQFHKHPKSERLLNLLTACHYDGLPTDDTLFSLEPIARTFMEEEGMSGKPHHAVKWWAEQTHGLNATPHIFAGYSLDETNIRQITSMIQSLSAGMSKEIGSQWSFPTNDNDVFNALKILLVQFTGQTNSNIETHLAQNISGLLGNPTGKSSRQAYWDITTLIFLASMLNPDRFSAFSAEFSDKYAYRGMPSGEKNWRLLTSHFLMLCKEAEKAISENDEVSAGIILADILWMLNKEYVRFYSLSLVKTLPIYFARLVFYNGKTPTGYSLEKSIVVDSKTVDITKMSRQYPISEFVPSMCHKYVQQWDVRLNNTLTVLMDYDYTVGLGKIDEFEVLHWGSKTLMDWRGWMKEQVTTNE